MCIYIDHIVTSNCKRRVKWSSQSVRKKCSVSLIVCVYVCVQNVTAVVAAMDILNYVSQYIMQLFVLQSWGCILMQYDMYY